MKTWREGKLSAVGIPGGSAAITSLEIGQCIR